MSENERPEKEGREFSFEGRRYLDSTRAAVEGMVVLHGEEESERDVRDNSGMLYRSKEEVREAHSEEDDDLLPPEEVPEKVEFSPEYESNMEKLNELTRGDCEDEEDSK